MSHNARRRPPSPRRDAYQFGQQNSRHDFDFRSAPNGPAPSFPSTSGQNRDSFQSRGRGRDRPRGHRPNRGGRGRGGWKKFTASDREIFRARRSPTPEQMAGMNGGDSRFRVLEDLPSQSQSDSEAAAAHLHELHLLAASVIPFDDNPLSDIGDISSEDEHPRAKRARTIGVLQTSRASPDSKPQWSNPDPYTVLPPPSQSDGPKRDVVAMIRNAKVENAERASQKAQADDFISLNFDDEGNEKEEGEQPSSPDHEKSAPRSGASDGPRTFDNDARRVGKNPEHVSVDRWPPRAYDDDHDRPRQRRRSASPQRDRADHYAPQGRYSHYPASDARTGHPGRRASPPFYSDDNDDEDYVPSSPHPADNRPSQPPPHNTDLANGKRKRQDGPNDISAGYLPSAYGDATPWMVYCNDKYTNPGEWLHDEMNAFHRFVLPEKYEREMRQDIIHRVNEAFKLRYHNVQVEAFGSFATDLYLPVSDMDLVALSSTYRYSGIGEIGQSPSNVRTISRNIIEKNGLCRSAQPILHAKVPIIKFTDITTGIHVDISFENDSGLRAVPIVEQWIHDYPALPYLVYPIKHLLASRQLNDVSTGGIGGFSIICIIAHRLHDLSRDHDPRWILDNLDFALMNFLEFYGRKFDYRLRGLDMAGMRFIDKFAFRGSRQPQPGRMLIVDPNNSTNDVSGGTSKIPQILRLFNDLHKRLGDQMSLARTMYRDNGRRSSVLKCMLDSGFDSYRDQRSRLSSAHSKIFGGRDDDVQIVGSRSIEIEGSQRDVVDLTSVDDPPTRVLRSNDQAKKQAEQGEHVGNSFVTGSSAATTSKSISKPKPPTQAQQKARMREKRKERAALKLARKEEAARKLAMGQQAGKTAEVPRKEIKGGTEQKSGAAVLQPALGEKAKIRNKAAQKTGPALADDMNSKQSTGVSEPIDTANASKPATLAKPKKSRRETKKEQMANGSRAASFKERFPGVACPDKLSKNEFKNLVNKHQPVS